MNKMRVNKIIGLLAILVAILVLTIGGVFAYSEHGGAKETLNTAADSRSNNLDEKSLEKHLDEDSYIKYTATTNGTALDQLLAINQTVDIKESEYGKLVNSINGQVGGTDGKYWSLYVDGEMSAVGADAFKPEGGELIEWKFQSL